MSSSPTAAQLLSLTHLTRRYASLTAVDDISLQLSAGARHAIIGPNGAGKTTLLNLIAGTDRPDQGEITLDGDDITRTSPAQRSQRGIARSFQQPSAIAELSTLDNVVLAGWRHHPQRRGAWRRPTRLRQLTETALHHLDAVGLADVAHQPAAALSHGQRRMLDLAAALAASPRLLLLDEPAAGLTDRDIVRRRLPADRAPHRGGGPTRRQRHRVGGRRGTGQRRDGGNTQPPRRTRGLSRRHRAGAHRRTGKRRHTDAC